MFGLLFNGTDIALTAMTITRIRAEFVAFSHPFSVYILIMMRFIDIVAARDVLLTI